MQTPPKLPKIPRITKSSDDLDDLHSVLVASLRNDKAEYVIDFSCAQYGFEGPVETLEAYMKDNSTSVDTEMSAGSALRSIDRIVEGDIDDKLEPWFDVRALVVRRAIMAAVVAEIDKFEIEQGVELHRIFDMPHHTYAPIFESLSARVKEVIRAKATLSQSEFLPKNDYLDRKITALTEKNGKEPTAEELYKELEEELERGVRLSHYKSNVKMEL